MKEKKHTGLFVVIGVLIFLVLVLVGLVGVLAWKSFTGQEEKGLGGQHSGEQIAVTEGEKNGDLDDSDFGTVVEDEEFDTYSATTQFVVGGYEFTVPGEYDLLYNEMVGTVVYMDDVFQMKTAVVENSYDEVMKNPKILTQASVDAGGTILQDIQETELAGKKYAYYRVDLSGDECFVVYTAAPDYNKRIAGQIALEKEDLSDEDVLQVFSSIVQSAVETDKPDSTYDDIAEQISSKTQSEIHGEMKEESTMQLGSQKVIHKVPEGFYSDAQEESSEYVVEYYYTIEPRVDVECYLYDSEWFDSAKGYIEASKHQDDTKIESMEIDGNVIYYIVEKYKNDDSDVQWIYAGCDLGDNAFYIVEAYVSDEEIDLSMDTIADFLSID